MLLFKLSEKPQEPLKNFYNAEERLKPVLAAVEAKNPNLVGVRLNEPAFPKLTIFQQTDFFEAVIKSDDVRMLNVAMAFFPTPNPMLRDRSGRDYSAFSSAISHGALNIAKVIASADTFTTAERLPLTASPRDPGEASPREQVQNALNNPTTPYEHKSALKDILQIIKVREDAALAPFPAQSEFTQFASAPALSR